MAVTPAEDRLGVLAKIFQSGSTGKILDFLIDHKDLDYSFSEIAENCDLSLQTVAKEIANLVNLKIIVENRRVGKTAMYRLDTGVGAIQLLTEFALQVSQVPTIQEYRTTPYQEVIPLQTSNS